MDGESQVYAEIQFTRDSHVKRTAQKVARSDFP